MEFQNKDIDKTQKINYSLLLGGIAVFGSLYIASRYSFLLFHSLSEIYSILIAFSLFILVWNTREYSENNNLILLGVAYLFIGFIDLLHTLSFKGMNIFTDYQFYANQLWVAARMMESITLLIFASGLGDRIKKKHHFPLLAGFGVLTGVIILSIFYWKVFPICFVATAEDGSGYQTNFKIISGYLVIALLGISMIFMRARRNRFNPLLYSYFQASLLLSMASEFCFTLYISNYGPSNQIGHYLKIISFYLIYKSVIKTGLNEPFSVIFKQLKEQEEYLKEAREQAVEANRSKSRFLANMSHEIRTPLNAVISLSTLLSEMEMTGDQKEYVRIINTGGKTLLALVNDILDMSKIEFGKMEIKPRDFSLKALTEEVSDLITISAKAREIDFAVVVDEKIPGYLHGDPDRLRQILLNLSSNAVKFTDEGWVSISVSGSMTTDNTVALHVDVEDSGIGMTPEESKALFNEFTQIDSGTNRRAEGTGLGLAISKSLVELMGGTIGVDSIKGKGTHFWFELELPQAENYISVEVENQTNSNETTINKDAAILIVEDNMTNVLVAKALLKKMGMKNIDTASSGNEALKKMKQKKFDLVFMDCHMPGLDGLETTTLIREGYEGIIDPSTVVIALTADAMETAMEQCIAAGMNDFMAKPISPDALRSMLKKHIPEKN